MHHFLSFPHRASPRRSRRSWNPAVHACLPDALHFSGAGLWSFKLPRTSSPARDPWKINADICAVSILRWYPGLKVSRLVSFHFYTHCPFLLLCRSLDIMDDATMVKGLTEWNLLVLVSCVFLSVYLFTETRQTATLAQFTAKNLVSYSLPGGFKKCCVSRIFASHTESLPSSPPRTETKGRDEHCLLTRAKSFQEDA